MTWDEALAGRSFPLTDQGGFGQAARSVKGHTMRLTLPLRSTAPRRGRLLRRLAALAVTATAGAAFLVPGAAQAQELQSVAITTDVSGDYLVLDVEGGSTRPGAGVIQWYGHFGANQRWNFVEMANGHQRIVNQKSGMCLTTDGVAGHRLFQWYCNGDAGQEWRGSIPNKFSPNIVDTGYRLINPVSGLAVDIAGGNAWAGARAIGWYPNGGANQSFHYYQLF
jgi:Ricin-type beta-trefoil lectin domain-like